jgi:hypothetical protein
MVLSEGCEASEGVLSADVKTLHHTVTFLYLDVI